MNDAMTVAHKALGAGFLTVGLAVGGYFLVFELYAGQGNLDDAFDIWRVLDWFMAVTVVLLPLVTYALRRALPTDADTYQRLAASLRFYGSLVLLFLFFNVWFAGRWGTAADVSPLPAHIPIEWIATDILLAILATHVGLRLLREEPRTA